MQCRIDELATAVADLIGRVTALEAFAAEPSDDDSGDEEESKQAPRAQRSPRTASLSSATSRMSRSILAQSPSQNLPTQQIASSIPTRPAEDISQWATINGQPSIDATQSSAPKSPQTSSVQPQAPQASAASRCQILRQPVTRPFTVSWSDQQPPGGSPAPLPLSSQSASEPHSAPKNSSTWQTSRIIKIASAPTSAAIPASLPTSTSSPEATMEQPTSQCTTGQSRSPISFC